MSLIKSSARYVGWNLRMPWFVFWAALMSITWFYLVRRVISWDLWWHMAAGRYLCENGVWLQMLNPKTWLWGGPHLIEVGAYPPNDVFTFSDVKMGSTFLSATWLGDVIFYQIYNWFGFYGLQAFRAAMILTPVVLALHLSKWKYNVWTLLGASLLIIGTMQKHLIKNAIIILPLLSLMCWVWIQVKFNNRKKLMLLIPLILSFWNHFHGSSMVGLSVLFVILVGEIIDSIILPGLGLLHPRTLKDIFSHKGDKDSTLVTVSVVCVATCLIYFLRWEAIAGILVVLLLAYSTSSHTRPFFAQAQKKYDPITTLGLVLIFFASYFLVDLVWANPMNTIVLKVKSVLLAPEKRNSQNVSTQSAPTVPITSPQEIQDLKNKMAPFFKGSDSDFDAIAKIKTKLRTIFVGTDAKLVAEYQWPFEIHYVLSVKAMFLLILIYVFYFFIKITFGWRHFHFSIELTCIILLFYLSLGYLRTLSYAFVATCPFLFYNLNKDYLNHDKKWLKIYAGILGVISVLILLVGWGGYSFNLFLKIFFGILGYTQWLTIPMLFIIPAIALILFHKDEPEKSKKAGIACFTFSAIVFLGFVLAPIAGKEGQLHLIFPFPIYFDNFCNVAGQAFNLYHNLFIVSCSLPTIVLGSLLYFSHKWEAKRAIEIYILYTGAYTILGLAGFSYYENLKYKEGDFHNISGFLDTEPGLGKSNKFFDGMANYVLEKLPPKNIYNTYNMGGYLQWMWYGKRKVFIDGRSTIFETNFYQAYTMNNAQEYIQKNDFEHAIINMLVDKDRLQLFLRQGWTPIVYDPGMTILQRPKRHIDDVYDLLPTYQEGERTIANLENLDRQALGGFINMTIHHMMLFGRIKDGVDFMEQATPIIDQLVQPELIQQLKGRKDHVQRIAAAFGKVNHPVLGELCKKLFDNVQGFDLHFAMGNAYRVLQKWAQAENEYGQAYNIKKDNKDLMLHFGEVLHMQQKHQKALIAFQEGLNLDQSDPRLHNAAILPLIAVNELDKALMAGQNAIRLNRNFIEAYYNLALVHEKKNELDQAMNALKQALQIKPDFAQASELLKKLEAAQKS